MTKALLTVGAAALVLKDVPDHAIVGGVPAFDPHGLLAI